MRDAKAVVKYVDLVHALKNNRKAVQLNTNVLWEHVRVTCSRIGSTLTVNSEKE